MPAHPPSNLARRRPTWDRDFWSGIPAHPTPQQPGTATFHVGPRLLVGNTRSPHQPAARHGDVPRGTEPSGREYQLTPPPRTPARRRPTRDRDFWSGIPLTPPSAAWHGNVPRGTELSGREYPLPRHPRTLARQRPTWNRDFWSGIPAHPPSSLARRRPTWDRDFWSGIPAHPTPQQPGTATSHVGPSLLVGNTGSAHHPAARHGNVPRGTETSGRECRLSPPPLSPAR